MTKYSSPLDAIRNGPSCPTCGGTTLSDDDLGKLRAAAEADFRAGKPQATKDLARVRELETSKACHRVTCTNRDTSGFLAPPSTRR